MTPAEHLARAEAELTAGDYEAARTHALIAIAGALVAIGAGTYTAGVLAGAEAGGEAVIGAVASLLDLVNHPSKPPAGAGDPIDPNYTGNCRRCGALCQWGWCPTCQPDDFARLP